METQPLMSWVNLGEVAYIVQRRSGAAKTQSIVRSLRRGLTLESPSPQRVLEAAALKAGYAISYADAFAVATAIARDCRLLTGDPEILAGDPSWPVDDLRIKAARRIR